MSEPKKCPVCEGSGIVPYNFYKDKDSVGFNEKCRTCNGIGILWTKEWREYTYPPIQVNETKSYDPCENCPTRLSPTFNGICNCSLPYIVNTLIRW